MKQFGIGQPVRRVEDRRFLTGRGHYLDDIVRPRRVHAALLRSPHAHARIPATAPGVIAVLARADLAQGGGRAISCVTRRTRHRQSCHAADPRAAAARAARRGTTNAICR
jgi:carbon-monoxide dehydrogenase large subunit